MKWFNAIFIGLFTIVPLVFLGFGGYMAWSQHHKITTYQPVPATVLSADVKTIRTRDSRGRTSTSYKPVVKYRYQVDGRTHTCDAVTPIEESGMHSWAHGIVEQYPAGQETEAYYNPADPSEAFLVKQYSFFPYVFLLCPMPFWAIAIGVGVGTGMGRRGRSGVWPVSGGWYQLRPTTRLASRRSGALIVSLGWHIAGVLAWGHFFRVAEPPYGLFATITTVVYETIGLVPVGIFLYYFRLGRILSDARLLIDTQQLALGDEITIRVEQGIFTALQIDEMSVALVCEETRKTRSGSKTTVSSHKCYEDGVPVMKDRPVTAGEPLGVEHAFRIPDDGAPTSPPSYAGYPRYAWRFEVITQIPGQPDYRGKFPVTVEGRGAVPAGVAVDPETTPQNI